MDNRTALSNLESFFEIFKKRWLNTNELMAFLSNIRELIKRNLVKVTLNLDLNSPPQSKVK
jgi:hypothetical protein